MGGGQYRKCQVLALKPQAEVWELLRGIAPLLCVVFLGRWRVYHWLNCP